MPLKYEKIKESELKAGKSKKVAERIAAATYNKERKPGEPPVTRNSDSQSKRNFRNMVRGKMKAAFPED